MTTDLYGTPLGAPPTFELSPYQKRQAALLYHWTSKEYLEGLLALINGLIAGADTTLDLAGLQGRDQLIANEQWGVRDTSANWRASAWPALQAFKESTIWHIEQRAHDNLDQTGLTQCGRMLDELSPYWMTPSEKAWFDSQWRTIDEYADRHDLAVGVGEYRPLHDLEMSMQWELHAHQFSQLPKFNVHTNHAFATGERPIQSGVYVPVDDPNGTLQFAWTGSKYGALGQCTTLSEVGLEILRQIGRHRLWLDRPAMVATVGSLYAKGILRDRGGFSPGDESDPDCVNFVITSEVFKTRPCKWFYVEMIDGEFEDSRDLQADGPSANAQGRLRCEAPQPCPRTGLWFTPAASGSRQFRQGESMPQVNSDYGQTIWYLEHAQN